nr:class F sortase [Nocardioides marinus]
MPRRRALLAWAGGGLAVLLAVVVIAVLSSRGGEAPTPAAPVPAPPSSTPSVPPGVDTTRDATYAAARPGSPDRLVVPALDVDAPIRPITAPDRTLVPPADPQVLGWWADGARPGAETGSALVVGHTVHTGGGALDDLETLRRGDEVHVHSHRGTGEERRERTETYRVEDVEVYRKGALARRAAELFSQEVDGRLVLLTCEDWDGTRYLSNVVVTALPVADDGGTARG